MSYEAQATVAFATRVPTDVDARRRRLQRETRCTLSELIEQALVALDRLDHGRDNGAIRA
jgi:hypothetical protein